MFNDKAPARAKAGVFNPDNRLTLSYDEIDNQIDHNGNAVDHNVNAVDHADDSTYHATDFNDTRTIYFTIWS